MTSETPISADENVNAGEREQEISLPPRPAFVHAAFVFTMLYMAFHVYWAVGGSWGLPLLAQHEETTTRVANWVVSVIMLIGAFWVLALKHPAIRRVPSWVLLTPLWAAAAVCVSHALYGFITKALYVSGQHGAVHFPKVAGVDAATAASENHLSAVHDLWLFEPCFLLQGLVLWLAAWQYLRTPAGRRRWSWSLVAGVILIDVFGALLTAGGMRFALS